MNNATITLVIIGFLVCMCLLIKVTCNRSIGSDCTITWFHRPGCHYCTQMENEWDTFVSIAPRSVNIKKIDVSKPQHIQMAQKYGVIGVPHIVKEKHGKLTVFDGPRKSSELIKFAQQEM
jgi:glutaredoxin